MGQLPQQLHAAHVKGAAGNRGKLAAWAWATWQAGLCGRMCATCFTCMTCSALHAACACCLTSHLSPPPAAPSLSLHPTHLCLLPRQLTEPAALLAGLPAGSGGATGPAHGQRVGTGPAPHRAAAVSDGQCLGMLLISAAHHAAAVRRQGWGPALHWASNGELGFRLIALQLQAWAAPAVAGAADQRFVLGGVHAAPAAVATSIACHILLLMSNVLCRTCALP